MRVNWDDLLLAYEFVSSVGPVEHQAWLCRTSGKIFWDFGEGDRLDEPSDGLDEPSEDSEDEESGGSAASDDPDRLPADIDDEEKYLPIPGKRELDLGTRLVFAFTREFMPTDYDDVRRIFGKRGAYSKFKGLLARRNAVDQWHDFEDKATTNALREWCEVNSIEIEEPERRPKTR